ncbi:DUF166 family protein [Methanocaldococcus infernus]
MKVAIITDGAYGENAYKTISKRFPTDLIRVSYSGELDDLRVSFDKPLNHDLYILYIRDPDATLEVIKKIREKGDEPIILGISFGKGLAKKFKNVYAPELLCSDLPIEPFNKYFGTPKVKLYIKNNKIYKYEILKETPCGSVEKVLEEFKGKEFNDKTLKDMGLRIQHFCKAGKLRLFKEKTCKKVKVGENLVKNIEVYFMSK